MDKACKDCIHYHAGSPDFGHVWDGGWCSRIIKDSTNGNETHMRLTDDWISGTLLVTSDFYCALFEAVT